MTIAMAIIVVIAAAVGGVVTIVRPETLNFQEYLDNLVKLAFAVAGLGAGRALKKGLQARAVVDAVTGPAGAAGSAAAAVGLDPGMLERFAAHPDHPSNELDA